MGQPNPIIRPSRFSLVLSVAFCALTFIAVIPSPAEAQRGACSAQGSIGPIPLGGFNCATGLQAGSELDIVRGRLTIC